MKISPNFRKLPFRTRVIRKIAEISPEEFSKVYPPVPENYFFLKTLEESGFDQFTFYYILVYQGKQLAGVAPCFSVDYALETSVSGPLRRLLNYFKKAFPRLLSLKALVCGIPMGQGQAGTGGSPEVFMAIAQRMESLARRIHAPFVAFKDFDRSYDGLFRPLLQNGFLKISHFPMTRLKLDFPDFEGYLKGLSSATRYDLRRKLKKAAGVKIEPSLESALDEATLDEAYGLYLQAVDVHDEGFEIVPKEFFRLISKNMPQEAKFFLWRINGKLAAFMFAVACEGVLVDYYLGLDQGPAHEYHLYFVKFKQVMDWCLSHGMRTYEMGPTGYEPKRRLKFEFVPVYLYVKARHKALRPLLKCLSAVLKPENFDPEIKRWKRTGMTGSGFPLSRE